MSETEVSRIKPWLVWGSAGLFTMYQFLLQGSPSVMIPNLIEAFGVDAKQVGLITTYFFYSYIVMQVPAGILVDVFGPKIVLIIGAFSAATACVIFSNAHHLWMAKSTRMFMGFVCAPGVVSTLTLASRWFTAKRFALITGLTETLAMVGAAVGTFVLAVIVYHYGWREAIFFCAIVGYSLTVMILLCVKNFPPSLSQMKVKLSRFNFKIICVEIFVVIRSWQVWLSGLYSGLMFAIVPSFMGLWSIPFFGAKYHLTTPQASKMIFVAFIGAAIGGPTIGWISGKLQRRKPILILSALFTLLIFAGILLLDLSLVWIHILLFVMGFCLSTYVLPFAVVSDILPPQVKGKAMGFTNMLALSMGAPLFQPLIGSCLKTPTEDLSTVSIPVYTHALSILLIALSLAFIISFFIKETYCQPTKAEPT